MRRILLFPVVATVMATMIVISVAPVFWDYLVRLVRR